MKKILSSLLVLILCFGMFGCSGNSTTTVCKMGEGTDDATTITFKAKGDKVSTAEYVYVVNFVAFGYTEEVVQGAVDQGVLNFADIAGVSYKGEIKDGILTETIAVDYDKADMAVLVSKGIVISTDGKTPTFVGLEVTIDQLTKDGATCTK